ncbi:hypothetical protein CON36_36240 [Bacillus cereus]|uniref:Uncharacterized protein n=2 Tax=Bacillus cereus group TaxID=86661 RepID=A0A9X6SRR6_BACCE|nr:MULTISPECIES: hypothetical protein [Bacillus cereus group]PDZ93988.1 hypothetical protein CON36_36240 [Bacillus cereus]PFJ31879.1 hypothetical protein COJ15_29710 [Bacillus thuringiensis]PGP12664.1 hypothetical protein COA01_33135 [Bacillus cereus]
MSNATAIATATEPTEVKSIITDALYGTVDAQESIEILSELLFPGENLIEMIRNRKIINEITAKVKLFQEKTEIELLGITKEDDEFNVKLQFGEVNVFLAEQQKIMAHLTHVAKAYDATLQITYVIKQTIG